MDKVPTGNAQRHDSSNKGDVGVAAKLTLKDDSNSLAEAGTTLPASAALRTRAVPRKPVWRKWSLAAGLALGLIAVGLWLTPLVRTAMTTVSTDDAYVNGHVTFVAPRVAGQVARVLADDNYRVKKGDLLVELDKEPYQVQVAIKQAAVEAAEADLVAAEAQAHALVGQARGNRFQLEHAVESVRNQVATLKSNVAQLQVEEANLQLAERDYARNLPLVQRGAVTQADLDQYLAKRDVARSRVNSASQIVQQTRVGLGLPINYNEPLSVPEDLEQNYSLVRQSLQQLAQSVAAFGFYPKSWSASPQQAIDEFLKQDPQGDLDRIYAKLIAQSPAVKQSQAKLEQAKRDLADAELNLRYGDIVSEIDGVVTRRNVNPGNNVQVGQSLMAVRSITEIWIDANFKET